MILKSLIISPKTLFLIRVVSTGCRGQGVDRPYWGHHSPNCNIKAQLCQLGTGHTSDCRSPSSHTAGRAFQPYLRGGWWQKVPLWQVWSMSALPTQRRKGSRVPRRAGRFSSALELQGRLPHTQSVQWPSQTGPCAVSARKDGCPGVGKVAAAGLSA